MSPERASKWAQLTSLLHEARDHIDEQAWATACIAHAVYGWLREVSR